ncbi:MAG: TlpA family protein disulfide reductase [Deltaproteobacteria bacterium]|nr:TlpA family protein disulfide reductase [Deltaproteobacteria bacterium]
MNAVISLVLFMLLFTPVTLFAGDLWADLNIERIKERDASDFTLKDIRGREISLSGLKGKAVMLNFWATWCVPCREEMPSMESAYRKLSEKGLVIMAVNSLEPQGSAAEFVNGNGYTFPVLPDESGSISKLYNARFLPTTYLIDRQGHLIGKAIGARDWNSNSAIKFLEELLAYDK